MRAFGGDVSEGARAYRTRRTELLKSGETASSGLALAATHASMPSTSFFTLFLRKISSMSILYKMYYVLAKQTTLNGDSSAKSRSLFCVAFGVM